jgi:DNA-binding LacI/PurR family transcriptional regulator/DNA-binding transcriptional regulator YhcF (GntR family)
LEKNEDETYTFLVFLKNLVYTRSMRRTAARIARNGFRDITNSLRARIEAGEIGSGSFLPTERELQLQFRASRTTIRKALSALIDMGVAMNVPNKGVIAGSGPHRSSRRDQIALIEGGTYLLKVLGVRLSELLVQRGLHLVQLAGGTQYPMEYALQRAMDLEFAGAIVWSYKGFPDLGLIKTAAAQMPIVALDHALEGAETDLVTLDHEAAAYAATEQLIRNGCKRIGVTGMLDMLDITHRRFRGYMRALFANDMLPEPKNFMFTFTSGDVLGHQTELLECRLRAEDRPDGLIVLQDFCVPPVLECALRCGLSVPRDIKFVTLGDDVEVTVDGIGMTAVAFDWDALAEQAVQVLLQRLADRQRPVQVRFAPHRLIVRGMCGAPREEWTSETDGTYLLPAQNSFTRSHFVFSSGSSVLSNGEPTRSRGNTHVS